MSHRLLTGGRYGTWFTDLRVQPVIAALVVALSVLSAAPNIRAAERSEAAPASLPRPELLWEVPSPVPGAGFVDAALVDLNSDGLPDLLLTSGGRAGPWWTVALAGSTGDVLWSRSHEARPVVRPVRTSGGACLVAAAAGEWVDVLVGETGELWRRARLNGVVGDVGVGDVNGDGAQDIVCVSGFDRDDALVVLSGSDLGVLLSARSLDDDGRFGEGFGRPVVRDADGDELAEIYVSENLDSLTRMEADGTRAWTVALDERTRWFPKGAVTGYPEIGDVTGDGIAEVSVGCLAGRLAVFDPATGDTVATRRFGARSSEDSRRSNRLPRALREAVASSGEPVNQLLTVELDGRPGMELVFGCGNRFVYAHSPSLGEELWRFKSKGKVHDRPLAIDWDADGYADVVAWDRESVFVLAGRTGAPLDGFPEIRDPDEVLAADLDGDGLLEIVGVERGARRVAAWATGRRIPAAEREKESAHRVDALREGTK